MDVPDGLTLLRQYAQGKKGRMEEGKIVVGQWMIDAKAPTNYKAAGGSYLTNEAIFFFIDHMQEARGSYVTAAKQAGIPAISRAGTRTLQQYLLGQINETSAVDATAPAQLAVPVAPGAEAAEAHEPAHADEAAAAAAPTAVPDTQKQQQQQQQQDVPHEQPTTASKPSQDAPVKASGTAAAATEAAVSATPSKPADAVDASKTTPAGSGAVTDAQAKAAVPATAEKAAAKAKHAHAGAKSGAQRSTAVPTQVSKETRDILRNELVFETRSTVLKARGKNFVNVLKTTSSVLGRSNSKHQSHSNGHHHHSSSSSSAQKSHRPQEQYERYSQRGAEVKT